LVDAAGFEKERFMPGKSFRKSLLPLRISQSSGLTKELLDFGFNFFDGPAMALQVK
jgi:hypothetical protein